MSEIARKSYIICTSPRSGSTLLCKLLAATGKAGNPDSHFHNPSLAAWLKTFGLVREDYWSERDALVAIFQSARKKGSGGTNVFGLRLQRGSFDFFIRQAGILSPGLGSDVARIEAAFGPTLFIHLTRENKLDQAISLVKANQTGLWHRALGGAELERTAPPREPFYDFNDIDRHIKELTEMDHAWQRWFDRQNITRLRITYADLSANPTKALSRIFDRLGLGGNLGRDRDMPVEKLADETNQDWAARFQADVDKRNRQ